MPADPKTAHWSSITQMPHARHGTRAVALNSKIFVLGLSQLHPNCTHARTGILHAHTVPAWVACKQTRPRSRMQVGTSCQSPHRRRRSLALPPSRVPLLLRAAAPRLASPHPCSSLLCLVSPDASVRHRLRSVGASRPAHACAQPNRRVCRRHAHPGRRRTGGARRRGLRGLRAATGVEDIAGVRRLRPCFL